jgi:hypothetical protein
MPERLPSQPAVREPAGWLHPGLRHPLWLPSLLGAFGTSSLLSRVTCGGCYLIVARQHNESGSQTEAILGSRSLTMGSAFGSRSLTVSREPEPRALSPAESTAESSPVSSPITRKTLAILRPPGRAIYAGLKHQKIRSGKHHKLVAADSSFLAVAVSAAMHKRSRHGNARFVVSLRPKRLLLPT